ncbi:phosphoribosylanthranilate isomerase [Sandarakinorhabdus sp.]|uniref:phosphoribosylanthranilate isomerase n=1 Tax=Sandarakinorhabdus sp. TaxID=1916663 RepID=UPI0038F614A2
MMPFKICGLSTPESVDAAIAAGATWLGFIIFPPSSRHVDPPQLPSLLTRVPAGIGKVAVLVDADDALIDAVLAAGIDTLQLHGNETAARIAAVKARTGRAVWRAAGVATRAEITQAAQGAGPADLLLLDAKAPSRSPLPGGNGLSFDWRLLADAPPGRAFGLAGGLDAGNVGEAIRLARPAMVDVSSGVEEAAGVKSLSRIAAFAEAVRAAS